MTEPIELVPAADWVVRAKALHADGYVFLDFLSAQDESTADEVRTRVHLRARRIDAERADGTPVMIATDIVDTLPSLQHVYPGIAWHEREAAELLGLTLVPADGVDAIDIRPLLLADQQRQTSSAAPLRKAVLLAARQQREWPGAADPGSNRRRQRPIGVLDEPDRGSGR